MKSVLRSVKPYWFYLICEGIKKVEVGKTAPHSDEWDGIVYLYCSKDKKSFNRIPEEYRDKYRKYLGAVGAQFVCDKVIKTCGWRLRGNTGWCAKRTEAEEKFPTLACLTIDEIVEYAGGREVSGWHIADLKIYDKPRELSEFRKPLSTMEKSLYYEQYFGCNVHCCDGCDYAIWDKGHLIKCNDKSCEYAILTCASRSWQYVEEDKQ